MSKKIEEFSFEEIVRMGSEMLLDDMINGQGTIRQKAYRIMELAARWQYVRMEHEAKQKKEGKSSEA